MTPEQCRKIIDLGVAEIDRVKKAGGSAEATTFGDNHKQAFEKTGKEVIPQQDKTIEEIKSQVGENKNIEQERYVRDSEVAWFSDKWLYDLIHPFLRTANEKAGWKYEWDFSESFQFTIYRSKHYFIILPLYFYCTTTEGDHPTIRQPSHDPYDVIPIPS